MIRRVLEKGVETYKRARVPCPRERTSTDRA